MRGKSPVLSPPGGLLVSSYFVAGLLSMGVRPIDLPAAASSSASRRKLHVL